MNYEDAFDIGSIHLEPRLQEYLRRKEFNKENDIDPPIPEEKEFCITPYDLKMIKRHKQGKTKLYTSRRITNDPHFVIPCSGDFDTDPFDSDFKKDPRYQRMQKKLQSHKDAQKKIRDFEGIDEDYTIFHQSNPYDLKSEKRPSRISKPYEDKNNDYSDEYSDGSFNNEIMMDSRDLVLAPARPVRKNNKVGSRTNRRDEDNAHLKRYADNARGRYCYNPNERSSNDLTYNHPPRIQYKQRLTREQVAGGMEHNHSLNDVIGELDRYNKHLNSTYEYIDGEADLDTRTYTPGMRSNTRRETVSGYKAIPFGYGNGLPDVSLEDSLRGGIKDTKKKSVGFKNPFEHQFDYISEDISDYRHTVQMWPQNSRGQNVEVTRPNSGAARSERRFREAITKRR